MSGEDDAARDAASRSSEDVAAFLACVLAGVVAFVASIGAR